MSIKQAIEEIEEIREQLGVVLNRLENAASKSSELSATDNQQLKTKCTKIGDCNFKGICDGKTTCHAVKEQPCAYKQQTV
jgi:hypothetical protein